MDKNHYWTQISKAIKVGGGHIGLAKQYIIENNK